MTSALDFALGVGVGLVLLTAGVVWQMIRAAKLAEELAQEEPYHPPVTANSKWRHSNGAQYVVLLLTNEHSKDLRRYPITVVYRNLVNHTMWARPLDDWHRSMTLIPEDPE